MSVLLDHVLNYYTEKAQSGSRRVWKENGRIIIRASATGDCLRALWYDLNEYQQLPRSIDIVRAGEEGTAHQEQMRRTLRAVGIDIRDDEREVEIDAGEFIVRGHIDNSLYELNERTAILDYKREPLFGNLFAKHRPQMACYMAAVGVNRGIVLVDGKHQGFKPFRYFETIQRGKKGHFRSDFMAEIVYKHSEFYFNALIKQLAVVKYYQPDRLAPTEERDGVKVYPWNCFHCHFSKECRPKSFVAKIGIRYVLAEKIA